VILLESGEICLQAIWEGILGEVSVDLDSQDIDGLPFIDALKKTVDKEWSGILRVTKETDQIGSVFMRDGKVAWAVSKTQVENFSSFLERIGLIPKEKLSEIVSKYKALGKSKKLGELLEEEGLISHDKLRECLGAHISAAIASMMDDPLVLIEASHGEMVVDANLLFHLDEVLPDLCRGEEPVDASSSGATPNDDQKQTENNDRIVDILGNLAVLQGYRYSFVSGSDGKLLALHRSEGDQNPEAAVASATSWINSSATHSAGGELGKMECVILEHENGLLIAQSVDNEKQCFVAVSFEKDGKLGVIKHKISELIPSIRQFMI
jgi:predicted regulator of Ras-like GTPase activity (Roadblock/LC7/MglB family)